MNRVIILLSLILLLVLGFLTLVIRHPVRLSSFLIKETLPPSNTDGSPSVAKTRVKIEKIDEVRAGQDLIDIEIDGDKDLLFVSSLDEDAIFAIDADTYQVTKTFNLEEPRFLSLEQNFLWVTAQKSLTKINLQKGEILSKTLFPYPAYNFTLDSEKNRAYILHFLNNALSVVDTKTNEILKIIFTGEKPTGITQNQDYVYIANFESGEITVISKENLSVVKEIQTDGRPNQILADTENGRVYVTDSLRNQVLVIDASINNIVKTIDVDEFPHGLALASDTGRLFVAGYLRSSVSKVDRQTLEVTQVWEGSSGFFGKHGFQNLVISGDDSKLYVTNISDGTLVVFRITDSEE